MGVEDCLKTCTGKYSYMRRRSYSTEGGFAGRRPRIVSSGPARRVVSRLTVSTCEEH